MKKTLLLLFLLCSITAFSQAKPKVFGKTVPYVEYEITTTKTKAGKNQYEVTTKIFVLRERQSIFEIYARWENLVRNPKMIDSAAAYQKSLAAKELKNLGFHE